VSTPFAYTVAHETTYTYEAAVSRSQQLLHLVPRANPRQRCVVHALAIEPAPSRRSEREDCFGNPVILLEFDRPHRSLSITSTMRVEVEARPALELAASPPWEEVAGLFDYRAMRAMDAATLDVSRYRFESVYVRIQSALADYARDCFDPGTPMMVGVRALMKKIHREFRFDPDATLIATPLLEVLEKKRGVCQDFAHLMIGCLRSLGLSARYVSGYLLTRAPPGKPRLVGADASHAWISAYCPVLGWIDFDPTNNVLPDTQHITIAWGRDFSDVSPQRGVILGGGEHELDVHVTVMPVVD
jgi:transglutaminase-like putative cysteine protease